MTIPSENIPDALLISYYRHNLKHTQAPFGHSWPQAHLQFLFNTANGAFYRLNWQDDVENSPAKSPHEEHKTNAVAHSQIKKPS